GNESEVDSPFTSFLAGKLVPGGNGGQRMRGALHCSQRRFDLLSGQVSLNSDGLYAAHVVAVDKSSGAAVVDGLSGPDGSYKLVGVPPGTYQVLVEPLTGVYTLSDFNGWTCGYATNPTDCTSARSARFSLS
ncbi:MAG: carboxypeptidase-like regulatory domain-containing protein, partial [Terriglobia bacterium]